jgi:predicted amidohydrolase
MKLRISAVQYDLKNINRFEEFAHQVEHYVKTSAEFGAEIILFPEFMSTQLLSLENAQRLTINDLPSFTDKYQSFFSGFAKEYNMSIIGGTHVTERDGRLYNVAHLFHTDGTIEEQEKLHITPFEVESWRIEKGEKLKLFTIKGIKVAIIICYDIEFPEIVRMARAQGADIIFNPACTDDRQGFYRVRYTAHARAIENEVYVVTTGTVGSLTKVDFMRSNFGQAAFITPNDIPFPHKGILTEGELNQDMVITTDLDLDLLYEFREKGAVATWRDRRVDLYPDW